MEWQFNPYALPLLASAALAFALSVMAWRRRSTPGASTMAALTAAILLWCVTYALELLSASLAAKMFWTKLEYVAFVSIPVLWLVFVLQYTGREQWLTRRNLVLVSVVPATILLLVWTNPLHGLIHRSVGLDTGQPYTLLAITYGPAFWLHGLYVYSLMATAALILLRTYLAGTGIHRTQTGLLLIASLIPLAGNVLYVFRGGPVPLIDLTPMLFTVAGLLSVWSLFRFRFLDITPFARDLLIEGMADGLVVVDGRYRAVDFNSAARKMLGMTADQPVGQPIETLLPVQPARFPWLADSPAARWEAVLDSPQRFVDLQVAPLIRRNQTPRGWLVVMRDVSDQKRAEAAERSQSAYVAALRHASAALTSTLSLDEVLDRIMDEIKLVIPHDACNIMLVQAGTAVVARSRGYIERGLAAWHANLRLNIDETINLRTMRETRKPMAIADTHAFPGWIRLPEVEWLRSYAAAPVVVKGEVIGFLNLDSETPGFYSQEHAQRVQTFADQAGIALENARLFSSLQETNVQLQRAVQAREEMIQNVSHELRTPLTLIMGYLEFLQTRQLGEVSSDQEAALNVMLQQGQRLHFMVNSLLALQTFNPDKLVFEPVHLERWLAQVIAPWQRTAQETDHPIRVICSSDPGLVNMSAYFMELVIGNLLDNAIKFSPGGGVIEVRLQRRQNHAEIAVTDHGVGINPEAIRFVFDRFYQVDGTPTRRFGGIGIGLTLCQTIVQAHNGELQVESAGEGQGSTFRVSLPVIPDTPPANE